MVTMWGSEEAKTLTPGCDEAAFRAVGVPLSARASRRVVTTYLAKATTSHAR